MRDAPLCPTMHKVLETLLKRPGTDFSAEDVCEAVDCGTTHTRTVLEMLAQAGLIEQWEDTRGTITYVARK